MQVVLKSIRTTDYSCRLVWVAPQRSQLLFGCLFVQQYCWVNSWSRSCRENRLTNCPVSCQLFQSQHSRRSIGSKTNIVFDRILSEKLNTTLRGANSLSNFLLLNQCSRHTFVYWIIAVCLFARAYVQFYLPSLDGFPMEFGMFPLFLSS